MVASSKVSSKVSYSTSSTTNTAEESIDEQYSTLLQDLFSFRKQDPNLFQTLMDSLHHHQGSDDKQRRCDLDTFDNDDDDVIERLRNINDKREDMDGSTKVSSNLFRSETANIYNAAMKSNSKKKSSKKIQSNTMTTEI